MENWDNYIKQLSGYRNFSRVYPHQRSNEFCGPKVYKTFKVNRLGCPSCSTHDKDIIELTGGDFQGFRTTTTSYFNSFSIGHVSALNSEADKTAAVRMTDLLGRLGLDLFTFTSVMDFLTTDCEKGNLDRSSFGRPLERSSNAILRWADAISTRNEKAEIIAGGWKSLFSAIGEGFREAVPVIKDCDLLWDPRLAGLGTVEFEQIVSLKGPGSASGGSPPYMPGQGEENIPLFQARIDRMGADPAAIKIILASPIGINIGSMCRYSEDWYTLLSSLEICNRDFNNRFYSFSLCRELFDAVTGFRADPESLRRATAGTWDILKGPNRMEGFRPADDKPPEIWFKPMIGDEGDELMIRDYFGKTILSREDIILMVRDYYEEIGWDYQ